MEFPLLGDEQEPSHFPSFPAPDSYEKIPSIQVPEPYEKFHSFAAPESYEKLPSYTLPTPAFIPQSGFAYTQNTILGKAAALQFCRPIREHLRC